MAITELAVAVALYPRSLRTFSPADEATTILKARLSYNRLAVGAPLNGSVQTRELFISTVESVELASADTAPEPATAASACAHGRRPACTRLARCWRRPSLVKAVVAMRHAEVWGPRAAGKGGYVSEPAKAPRSHFGDSHLPAERFACWLRAQRLSSSLRGTRGSADVAGMVTGTIDALK